MKWIFQEIEMPPHSLLLKIARTPRRQASLLYFLTTPLAIGNRDANGVLKKYKSDACRRGVRAITRSEI